MKITSYNQEVSRLLLKKCKIGTRSGQVINAFLFLYYHAEKFALRVLFLLKNFSNCRKNRILSSIVNDAFIDYTKLPALSGGFHCGDAKVVLIVAELSIPQCVKYRVNQKIEVLVDMGWQAKVIPFRQAKELLRLIPLSSLVIFYRTPMVDPVDRMLAECRRLGIPVAYDIDDLVFDVDEYATVPALRNMSPDQRASLLDGARLYRECLQACGVGIASTVGIQAAMRKFVKGEVFVYENALDRATKAISRRVMPRRATDTIAIGYGSGTTTHDEDFALVGDALLRLLTDHGNVRLIIHGYLQLPEAFSQFSDRISRVGFLGYEVYQQAVGLFDVNIAPLCSNAFNNAKSNIKYIEAAMMGIPTVASATDTYREVIIDDVNGCIARDVGEWYDKLAMLVADPDLRQAIGAKARQTVEQRYGLEVMKEQMRQVLSLVPSVPKGTGRPRLLVVNTLYAPLSFGGATVLVEQLVDQMKTKWDITVVCSYVTAAVPENSVIRYEHKGVSVFALTTLRPIRQPNAYVYSMVDRLFGRVLDMVGPGVVHLHSIQSLGAGIVDQCVARNVPTAVTLHDSWWICQKQFMDNEAEGCYFKPVDLAVCANCVGESESSSVYSRYFALIGFLDKCDLLLAPSTFQKILYERSLPSSVEVKVNRNGVRLPALVAEHPSGRERIRFCYLGGVAKHKGYYFIKQIFEELEQENYELVLVDIHRRVGNLGIDPATWNVRGEITVVDPFAQDELDAFFSRVDVLLFPSQWGESFGLAVREAMARNVWVITTAFGGLDGEVVDGVNGDLVAIGDYAGYKAKIQRYLQQPSLLDGYSNPLKDGIRSIAEQAAELDGLLHALVESRLKSVEGP